ncbi:hypothetical protein ACJX0J_025475, partial [Zea mays]
TAWMVFSNKIWQVIGWLWSGGHIANTHQDNLVEGDVDTEVATQHLIVEYRTWEIKKPTDVQHYIMVCGSSLCICARTYKKTHLYSLCATIDLPVLFIIIIKCHLIGMEKGNN